MIPAVLGYVLLGAVIFGRALFPPEGQMIFGDDIHRSYFFFREFFNQSLSHGVFPWWNPYMFGGEPFIANPIVNIWYVPTWIFSVLPLPAAYGWHLYLHVVWAMIGMYVLCLWFIGGAKKERRLFSPAAWIAGVIFGLSGFFMARTYAGHVDMVAAASWIPWVAWAFYRLTPDAIEGRQFIRRMCLASAVLALQLFSGYQTMAMMSVIIVGILTIGQSIAQKRFRPVVSAILAGIGGLALAAIQLLPVSEFFRMSIRTFQFPYRWHAYGSLEWRSLLQLVYPFIFGSPATYAGPPPNFTEHSMFVGIVGLILAGMGAFSLFRMNNRTHKAAGIGIISIALIGFWISLGPNAGVDLQYYLWKWIPTYKYLRIPPRHLILPVFGLSVLSGFGASYCLKLLGRIRVVPFVLAVLVAGEMGIFGRGFIELKPVPPARHDKELIALLQTDTEPYRLLQNYGAWLPQRDAMDFDGGLSYKVYSATGYDPSILRPYFEYIAHSAGESGERAVLSHDIQVPYLTPDAAAGIDRLNIKYIQVPVSYDPFAGIARYRKIRESKAYDYRLYENTSVLPRFFLGSACGAVHIVSYGPNRIDLSVNNSCTTTLESSEVWYPGWEAYIDGKKTSISKTDNVFRTLIVTPGNHTVIYRYNPKIFVIGAGISAGTALVMLFFVCVESMSGHKMRLTARPARK